jgi:hypothetical protein
MGRIPVVDVSKGVHGVQVARLRRNVNTVELLLLVQRTRIRKALRKLHPVRNLRVQKRDQKRRVGAEAKEMGNEKGERKETEKGIGM